ncbi:MAG: Gfo/Idh/MocA family oxidoreductase [Eubacteriales bacterium]
MIRAGILGFAHGHVFSFAGEWIKHPEYGVEVVCGWDHDETRRKKSCADMGIEEAESAEQLLARADIDAVVITSETAYHAELAVKAANAKKMVILYKPMALTLAQADLVVEAVKLNKVPFTIGWQMRVDPVNIKIKELIDSGELGKTYFFRRRHCLGMHNNPDFKNMWHVNEQMNRDIFADDSAHAIDWLQSLFGVPETVSCEMSTMHIPEVKNDTGVALFKYSSGLIVEMMFSSACAAAEITSEGYFEKGALQHYCGDGPGTRLPHENHPALKWFIEGYKDWRLSEIPLPSDQGVRIRAQAKPMADFLNGLIPSICTAEEARASLRMTLACYLSVREGGRVRIDDERVYEI